jgi:DNA-binding HxlR family transcriptional regulator
MPDRRTYGDRCGIARGLDLVGERWALLVVRELLLGPKRFTDLRDGLPNVSPDVLAQRLRELETAGVVRRRKLPPPARARVYELTEWGSGLEPVLVALGRWGTRSPLPSDPAELSPDALAVALKSMFDADAAAGVDRTYHLRLGEHGFTVRSSNRELEVTREDTAPPETSVALETDPGTLTALLWHGGSVLAAIDTGALRLQGSTRELNRFLKLFVSPMPV